MAVKCKNGHWYDPNMHRACPHCKRAGEQLRLTLDNIVEDDRTVSIAEVDVSLGNELNEIIKGNDINTTDTIFSSREGTLIDSDKTISFGFFGMEGTTPVTGWLVCTEGEERGKDYRLHTGKNFIGRSPSMDVVLIDDKSIARDKHCSVIFDPVSKRFYLMSEGGNTVYLNGEMMESANEIRTGDTVMIGNTTLMFIPFCQEGRTWDGK